MQPIRRRGSMGTRLYLPNDSCMTLVTLVDAHSRALRLLQQHATPDTHRKTHGTFRGALPLPSLFLRYTLGTRRKPRNGRTSVSMGCWPIMGLSLGPGPCRSPALAYR